MKKTRRFLSMAITAFIMSVLLALPSFASASSASSGDSFSLFGLSGGQLAIAAVIIVAAIVLLVVIFKPKNKKGSSIAETESVTDADSEEKAEEAVSEDTAEAEKTVESEEVPESAAEVASETAAETAITEEAPAVTETIETKEEPAVVAEEVTPAAEVAQTEEVEEVKADEPAAIPTEAVDPETGCTYTFDEKGIPIAPEGMIIRYKWSFLGRLIQSDNVVKYRYMTLRRMLLAYSKVRSNVSWNYDSYFIGKKQIAKMKIRGKNLVVYFPIDPKTMEGTKYIGEDVSKVSRYKAVPFAYRINGNRKMKYAMELIAQLLEGVQTEAPEYNVNISNANSAIPFEDFDTLYLKGYIKIGGFLAVTRDTTASADDDDDEEEVATAQQAVSADEDDDDTEALPISASPVEKEVFNFNPKKK